MRTEPSFSAELESHMLDDEPAEQSSLDFSQESDIEPESQLLSDYRQRYGLSTDPFADDPHFPFYPGGGRRQVLDQLLHLCQFSHNLLVVAGEYGVGKTRMAQALIDSLDDADNICFLEGQINSRFDLLFESMLEQFELQDTVAFQEFARRNSEDDSLVVILVDNAHHLPDAVLAELILLMQSGPETRVHLVLFAEPHLLTRLDSISAPSVTLNDFHLEKFSLEESVDYLNFRMEMSDYLGPEIFTEQKVEAWWRQYRGQLLALHEFAEAQLLASVSSSRNTGNSKNGLPLPHIIGASVLFGALIMGLVYWGSSSSNDSKPLKTLPVSKVKEQEATSPISGNSLQVKQAPSESVKVEVAAPVAISKTSTNIEINTVSVGKLDSSVLDSPAIEEVRTEKKSDTSAVTIIKQRAMPSQQNTVMPVARVTHEDAPQARDPSAGAVTKNTVKDEKKNSDKKIKSTNVSETNTEQEKTILSWPESEFTLQLMGLSSEDAARKFVAEQPNRKDLLIFSSVRQGKAWYVVVVGHYPTSAKARDAIRFLPELQRGATPWSRDVKTIQKEIRQY
jgi:DamX protein